MNKYLKENNPVRYHMLLISLHWIMALAFIAMIIMGIVMTEGGLEKSLRFKFYQWHKSFGVLLLWAFVLRIFIRQLTALPPLPERLSKRDKVLAKAGHIILYAFMLLMPLSGWLMVSSSAYGLPTMIFSWFEWPHVPFVAANKQVHEFSEETHEWLAYSFIAVILLHVLAVLKHWYVDKVNILPRMGVGKPKE